jgi:radical SAM superfamily enzyme YgiQ (UPF0313 family)
MCRRSIQLIQLPIPQPGLEPAPGNVPLAAGYLKMYARLCGLERFYEIEIFPPRLSNTLSDCGLVEEILAREPWMVGFTCYLWNIDRTLWIASRLKERRPELRIILGGPEITADNAWVLQHPAIDFAVIGEGEQTFAELLTALRQVDVPTAPIAGLYVPPRAFLHDRRATESALPILETPGSNAESVRNAASGVPLGILPAFRQPLASLDEISSPYLAGILDAADEQLLLLETIRGCIFKCKFCYYPKSYDNLYFASREKIVANLRHARERNVKEVVLLDPTLNQARNFAEFVRLLADENPDHQWKYFGELRAEGITPDIARLLREANFNEVEIGLQSIDPLTMELMDRKNNLKAFERGVSAMLNAGLKVKVDLIIGLPGDTPNSVRRGMHYLRETGLFSSVQVFNLAVLPGTAFRQEAERHGLQYQPRPPYYVLKTPTIDLSTMYELMEEAEEIFETEFDALPSPVDAAEGRRPQTEGHRPSAEDRVAAAACPQPTVYSLRIDLDQDSRDPLPPPAHRSGAFELHLRASDFRRQRDAACQLIERLLADNPHSTLRVVLEPRRNPTSVTMSFLQAIRGACLREPSYLDRFYSMQLGRPKGAKHIVIRLPWTDRGIVGLDWIDDVGEFASIVWTGDGMPTDSAFADELEPHEFVTV